MKCIARRWHYIADYHLSLAYINIIKMNSRDGRQNARDVFWIFDFCVCLFVYAIDRIGSDRWSAAWSRFLSVLVEFPFLNTNHDVIRMIFLFIVNWWLILEPLYFTNKHETHYTPLPLIPTFVLRIPFQHWTLDEPQLFTFFCLSLFSYSIQQTNSCIKYSI